MSLPLSGILVLDFSQFLAGPVAAMRLGDLGARVVKIERPGAGEIGRTLSFSGAERDGDTLSFHAMNRNKESVAANLKSDPDRELVSAMVRRADVIIENFRPGVMARLGYDYESVKKVNPSIVYGSITGYGTSGPWATRPGQDLLAQSIGALTWLNARGSSGPLAVGVSIADHLASCQLALGVAALLVRRAQTGEGGLVETSLLEGVLDLQFELLTVFESDPSFTERVGGPYSANKYLPVPYGVYPTADGHLAIAMNPLGRLGELLGLEDLRTVEEQPGDAEEDRLAVVIADRLSSETTEHWLSVLEPADVWCAPVLTLAALAQHEGYHALGMIQETFRDSPGEHDPVSVRTTRSPLRVDGAIIQHPQGAPRVGEHTGWWRDELAKTSERDEPT